MRSPTFRDAVEDLIEVPEASGQGWLTVVDEVHTLSAKQLRRLAQKSPLKAPVIVPTERIFDEFLAKQFFSVSGDWIPVTNVSVEELRQIMPPGTVSQRARRVGISPLLIRLFDEGVEAKVATVAETVLALGVGRYLASVDLEKMVYACHCDEYRRMGFCEHMLLAIFHSHEAILEKCGGTLSPSADDWREAFALAQRHQHRRTMLCNWLYYFTKNAFASMSFRVGIYLRLKTVEKIIRLIERQ